METSLNVYDYPSPPEPKEKLKDVTVFVRYKIFDVVKDLDDDELIQDINKNIDDYLNTYDYDIYVEDVEL